MEQQPKEKELEYHTFIGVLISICGNILISAALNLQKRAHNKIQEKQLANYFANMDETPQWVSRTQYNGFLPDDGYSTPRTSFEQNRNEEEYQKFMMAQEQSKAEHANYLKSKLWWLGISLMIFGEVGNFVAYGFAPASTIAPLGTTTLVANAILAPVMLKEVFRKRDLVGVLLAVSGAATVVFSSNSEEIALSPELIVEAITQMRSIIYFILTGIAIVFLTILSPVYGSSSVMIDLGLVAIYGGYTVLSTKSVASLLSLTFLNMFTYPVSYLLIFVLIITAILQIKYLNKALQRFDSTEVIPTQFVLFTVSAIIGSAVIYHDFDDMTADQMSRFMLGCSIEFLGVYLITSKRPKNIRSPVLSMDEDSGTAISYSDDEGLDHIEELPNEDHQSIRMNNSNSRKRNSNYLNDVDIFIRSPQHLNSPLFGSWQQESIHNYHSLNNTSSSYLSSSYVANRRQSSVFRGISMASQLLDRNHEQQSIQLPSSNNPSLFSSTITRRDSTIGNIINGITSAITSHTLNSHQESDTATDSIRIDIPAPSFLSQHSEHHSERELMPIVNNKHVMNEE